jgi:hypothetical protein
MSENHFQTRWRSILEQCHRERIPRDELQLLATAASNEDRRFPEEGERINEDQLSEKRMLGTEDTLANGHVRLGDIQAQVGERNTLSYG